MSAGHNIEDVSREASSFEFNREEILVGAASYQQVASQGTLHRLAAAMFLMSHVITVIAKV